MTGRPRTYVPRHCAECGAELSRSTRGSLCRAHYMNDAEANARRAAAIKRTFALNPHLLAERGRKIAEANRRPERRERSAQVCRDHKRWEQGLPAANTAEARARQGRAQSETKLAHIPIERRSDYRALVLKVGASEAYRLVMEHQTTVLTRGFREISLQQRTDHG